MPWLVTCEIKLFQNYFSLRRRPSEIILFQLTETRQAAVVLYISGDKTPPCLVPLPTVNELDLVLFRSTEMHWFSYRKANNLTIPTLILSSSNCLNSFQ